MDIDCIPEPELQKYVLGNLAAERHSQVTAHLDACDPCQETVVAMADASDTFVGSLKQAAKHPNVAPENALQTGLAEILARSRSARSASEPEPHEENAIPIDSAKDHRIGPYQIHEQLGSGGMGRVFRAVHERLKRTVAIKLLSANRWCHASAVQRFQREMEAVGALDHPNIVRASDAGESHGMHYLVMEYVDGLDLSRLVRRLGPVTTANACEIARQCAVGLQYVHDNGLVHRDVKPSNLMLARNSAGSASPTGVTVKVLDLGLALLGDEHLTEVGEVTTVGTLMGTLDYMSPEQGVDSHSVDQRTDIYSLGATLFKLLTGRAPYDDPGHATLMKKMTALATKDVPSIKQVCTELPDELSTIIDRMLLRDPDQRFSSAAEVAELLTPFAADADLAPLLESAIQVDDQDRGSVDLVSHPSMGPPWGNVRTSGESRTTNTPAKQTSSGRMSTPIKVGIAAGLLGTLAIFAGVLFRMATDYGELIVSSDDPQATVLIKQNEKTVDQLLVENGTGRLKLRTGRYQLEVTGDAEVAIRPSEIEITRQSTSAAKVDQSERQRPLIEPPAVTDSSSSVSSSTTGPSGSKPSPPSIPQLEAELKALRKMKDVAEKALEENMDEMLYQQGRAEGVNGFEMDKLQRRHDELKNKLEKIIERSSDVEIALKIANAVADTSAPPASRSTGILPARQPKPVPERIRELELATASLIARIEDGNKQFREKSNRVQTLQEELKQHRFLLERIDARPDAIPLKAQREKVLADQSQALRHLEVSKTELADVKSALPAMLEAVPEALEMLQTARLEGSYDFRTEVIRVDSPIRIQVLGLPPDRPIEGIFTPEASGNVHLGPGYGRVSLAGLTYEEAEFAIRLRLREIAANPEVMVTNIARPASYPSTLNAPAVPPSKSDALDTLEPTFGGLTYAVALRMLKTERSHDELYQACEAACALADGRSAEVIRAVLIAARSGAPFPNASALLDSIARLKPQQVVDALKAEYALGNSRSRDFADDLIENAAGSSTRKPARRLGRVITEHLSKFAELRLAHPEDPSEDESKIETLWRFSLYYDPSGQPEVKRLLLETLRDKHPAAMNEDVLLALAKTIPDAPTLAETVLSMSHLRSDTREFNRVVAVLGIHCQPALPLLIKRLEVAGDRADDAHWGFVQFLPTIECLGMLGPDAADAVPVLSESLSWAISNWEEKTAHATYRALLQIDPDAEAIVEVHEFRKEGEGEISRFEAELNSGTQDRSEIEARISAMKEYLRFLLRVTSVDDKSNDQLEPERQD